MLLYSCLRIERFGAKIVQADGVSFGFMLFANTFSTFLVFIGLVSLSELEFMICPTEKDRNLIAKSHMARLKRIDSSYFDSMSVLVSDREDFFRPVIVSWIGFLEAASSRLSIVRVCTTGRDNTAIGSVCNDVVLSQPSLHPWSNPLFDGRSPAAWPELLQAAQDGYLLLSALVLSCGGCQFFLHFSELFTAN